MSEANSLVINTYKCAAALLQHAKVKGGFKGGILLLHVLWGLRPTRKAGREQSGAKP